MNEAELLFTQILNCSRSELYLNRNLSLGREASALVSLALRRRITGEPIQYILGKADFMGLEFKVNRHVLIPRPETEILVEKILGLVQGSRFKVKSILDIGTGSGCIAISLAKLIPRAKIDALDISEEALGVARDNARLHGVEINFIHSDLFAQYPIPDTQYDIIVANPPYIASGQFEMLQPEVRLEPRIALDGGPDGLDFYRRIIYDAPRYLKRKGYIVLEMGLGQYAHIKEILKASAKFEKIAFIKDYNQIERIVVAGIG